MRDPVYLGISLLDWLIAGAILVVGTGLLRIVLGFATARFRSLSQHSSNRVDDLLAAVLEATSVLFLLALCLFAVVIWLPLPTRAEEVLRKAITIALFAQGARWVNAGIASWVKDYRRRTLPEDAASATTMSAVSLVGRITVWALAVLLVLDNLGFDVTTLVAGLGIGGVAVALAVQNVLGDLFASLSIVLDKPFVIGDFLDVEGFLGSVEHIGLKTTRLRSLSGEQLVFSNADLLKSRIRNYGRMYERRIVFTLGVTYGTKPEQLEAIPGMIREIVEGQDDTRFDRSHFKGFADSALTIETVYYVTVPDYNRYMDIQQAINLALYRRFEREDVDFAYPTRTVHLVGETREALVGEGA